MKTLSTLFLLLVITAAAAFAQNSETEQAVLKLNSQYDEALMKKDLSFFERVFADDYVNYDEDGKAKNRAQALEDMRRLFNNPMLENMEVTVENEDVKIRTSGDLAVVTGKWANVWKNSKDASMPQHINSGRYTAIFEKRGGKWMIVSEQNTKAAHDNAQTIAELKYAKKLFDKALENKDRAFLNRHFADEYIYTGENSTGNKEQVIGYMVSPEFKHVAGSTAEDKKYLILGSDSAIETGRLTRSTDSDGKQQTQMITVWVRRNGHWQVIADYFYPVAGKQTGDGKESSSAAKGNFSFDTSLLRETTRVYEVSVGGKPVGDYVFAMKRDRLGGRDVFRVTRTYGNAEMKNVQSSVFDARTFEPISSSARGETVFDLTFSDGKITGEIKTSDGKSRKMDTDSHRGTLLPWMYEAALTMLPLKIGFENVLPVVNPKTARVDFVGARVVGEKSIEVPAGKFDVFEVELTGFQPETVYLRREPPHIPVKQDLPEPPISIRLKSAAGIEK